MQETLEDAILVLKSHAESSQENPAGLSMGSYPPVSYPQALTDQLQVKIRSFRIYSSVPNKRPFHPCYSIFGKS